MIKSTQPSLFTVNSILPAYNSFNIRLLFSVLRRLFDEASIKLKSSNTVINLYNEPLPMPQFLLKSLTDITLLLNVTMTLNKLVRFNFEVTSHLIVIFIHPLITVVTLQNRCLDLTTCHIILQPEQHMNKIKLPGQLTAAADTIDFHNKHCIMMIEGRRPGQKEDGTRIPSIIGLKAFASITKTIIRSAAADDPYADFLLIQLEASEHKRLSDFDELKANIDKSLEMAPSSIKVDSATSAEPVTFEITWGANPYAYRAAYLLKQFDILLNIVWAARFKGILTRVQADKFTHQATHKMRSYFSVVNNWRHLGVTRSDINQKNQLADKANEHYKFDLPEQVLSRELRGDFAPVINPALISEDSTNLVDENTTLLVDD
jgi:integrating conjugative element protein (TIGR03761 family)